MDVMKILGEKKEMIKHMIEKETDEKELKKLNEQLVSVVEEIADVKAEEKAGKTLDEKMKEIEEKAMKAAMETAPKESRIEVTQAGEYKGVSLKRVVAEAGAKSPAIARKAKDNYEGAEKVAKLVTDMVQRSMAQPTQKAAMIGGTDALGGYITPTEERMEILGYMRETSIALQDARIERMTSDTMTFPKELFNAVVDFRAESGSVGATSATFEQVSLATKGLDGYVLASKEIVADSPTLIATLMSQLTEATAKKIDSAVFIGTGDPVSGVFGEAAGYSVEFDSGSTAFSELLAGNIDSLLAEVFKTVQDTSRLRWYVHPAVFYRYIKGLKNSDGDYLYWDSIGGLGVPGNFAGFPVRFVHQAPSVSAADTALAAFGDLSGMIIGERLSTMQLFYDPYVSAGSGQDRFYWFTRWAFNFALPKKLGRVLTAAT